MKVRHSLLQMISANYVWQIVSQCKKVKEILFYFSNRIRRLYLQLILFRLIMVRQGKYQLPRLNAQFSNHSLVQDRINQDPYHSSFSLRNRYTFAPNMRQYYSYRSYSYGKYLQFYGSFASQSKAQTIQSAAQLIKQFQKDILDLQRMPKSMNNFKLSIAQSQLIKPIFQKLEDPNLTEFIQKRPLQAPRDAVDLFFESKCLRKRRKKHCNEYEQN